MDAIKSSIASGQSGCLTGALTDLHSSGGNSVPVGARVGRSGGGRHPGDGMQAFMVARSFPLIEVTPRLSNDMELIVSRRLTVPARAGYLRCRDIEANREVCQHDPYQDL